MNIKTKFNELWGEDGPYSQAQLITEARVLDDKISRTFLIVSVNINPFTLKLVRKHIGLFKGDVIITGIAKNAAYKGPKDGYSIYVFQQEYMNERVMKDARIIFKETNDAIIRMHRFVMDELKRGGKFHAKTMKQKIANDDRERLIATQRLMTQTFMERYLKETGKKELSGIDEANGVMKKMMNWWNGQLSRGERLRIEALSKKEQVKIFMAANVDLSDSKKTPSADGIKIGRNDSCPCGSGVKYKKCCFLKLH